MHLFEKKTLPSPPPPGDLRPPSPTAPTPSNPSSRQPSASLVPTVPTPSNPSHHAAFGCAPSPTAPTPSNPSHRAAFGLPRLRHRPHLIRSLWLRSLAYAAQATPSNPSLSYQAAYGASNPIQPILPSTPRRQQNAKSIQRCSCNREPTAKSFRIAVPLERWSLEYPSVEKLV